MILDFKFTLAFALTIFYIVFLKLINIRFYYFILTMIKNLKFF